MMAPVTGYGAQPGRALFLVGILLLTGPALAQDAGLDSSAPSEVRPETPPPLLPKEQPPPVELPLPAEAQPENFSRAMLVGIKDITELSLEDLLNAEMTTSTQSKPMSIRDSPNVMTVVTREEIQRSGARELADVLRLVPGFQLGGDLYSSVFAGFRGIWGSEGKLMVLLDGHEMFELLYYAAELGNRIPVDQIARIEIVRGPGSVVYGGSAELAVVNIITRSAEEIEGASVTGVYGQMFDGAIHEGQSLANTFARRTISAELGKSLGGPNGLRLKLGLFAGQGNRSDQNYTDIEGTRYNFAGNARSDPFLVNAAADFRGLSVRYLFEYYRTTMRDGYDVALADALPVNYLSSSLNVSYEWKLPRGLKVVPRFHWLLQEPWRTATETARTVYPTIYWKPRVQRMLGGANATWDVVRPLNLLAGTEYYVDSAADALLGFLDPNNPTQTRSHVSYWNASVYGQALLETPWANISAGARYEHRKHVGGAFVPRVGFTKTFGPFHYKLLASRAFRSPSIENLAQTPNVKPELTTVYEIELGYKIHPALFAVVNGYDITIKRPFVYFYDDATGTDGYRNYDRMGTRGAELELRFRTERLFANLSYSYYTAAGKDKIDGLAVPGNSSALLGFSPHKVALLAGFGLSQHVDASVSASVLGPQRFGYYAHDVAGTPLARDFGAEVLLNAYVCYKNLLVPGGFAGIGIYNLANEKTALIQPFNNGHAPIPGPSREVFLRIGYGFRRTAAAPPELVMP
jgi:outer membrane receptor protein involved in Fe transport